MNLTLFGSYNTATTPRVQVLIDGLRAHNITVNECNVPLKFSTTDRVNVLQRPWKLPLLVLLILKCWFGLVFKRLRQPQSQAVIVGHLGQFDVHLARLLFRNQPIILDYMISGSDTADDRQVSNGLKDKLLRLIDRSALKVADIIIVDTDEHLEALPTPYKTKAVVVDVGAPAAWFKASPSLDQIKNSLIKDRSLKVIFFGNYIPLQGAPVIAKALSLLDGPVEVTMAGHGQELAKTMQLIKTNKATVSIKWLNWVDNQDLPRLVADHDICLGIFGTSQKALEVVPNKVYQGSAVGCAIITSDTEPQRRLLADAATYVPPGDPKALLTALYGLINDRSELLKMRQAALSHAQSCFSPKKVIEPLIGKINFPI